MANLNSPIQQSAVVPRAMVYAGAAPGVSTNILTTGITFGDAVSACRVTVCLTTSSVFNVYVTDGSTAYTMGLNASGALNAGDLYTFVFGVCKYSSDSGTTGLTYNFRVETDSVINYLRVEEVIGSVV